MSAPLLKGIRVLDLTRLLPGPFATLFMADHGADVIKIEDPVVGDYARSDMAIGVSMSHLFHAVNRGKRSVALDLKSEAGRDAFLRMATQADVVVESFRPGVMASLGLAPDTLRDRQPSLIVCSISAYGQTGPMSAHPAHDNNMVGYAGIADQFPVNGTGERQLPNFQIADMAGGGLTALSAISMALVRRERTGEGATLDIAMAEAAAFAAPMAFASLQLGGSMPPPGGDVLTGALPCYGYYRTSDDRQVAMGALEPKFWKAFCEAVERPDLLELAHAQGEDGARARKALTDLFASKTRDQWAALLEPVKCCVTPVYALDEFLALEHTQVRRFVFNAEDPDDGRLVRLASPIVVDGERVCPNGAAPRHGQHAQALLPTSD